MMMGTESFPLETWKNWKLVEECPYVIGDFVWTGMDYLGETGIGNALYVSDSDKISFAQLWPWVNAWCGDIDICGNKKPQSYFRDVVWGNSKIEMAVHEPMPEGKKEIVSMWGWPNELQSWNWKGQEGKMMNVNVYSSCSTIRLELNGQVIGEKKVIADSNLTVSFQVPYEPGELKAIGLSDGKDVAKKIIATTGKAAKVMMHTEHGEISCNRNDLAYVTIEITDENGNVVPDEDAVVEVTLKGEGELLAFGNACPNKPCSYRQSKSNTFRGKALLIIRPTGKAGIISVTVSSPGLGSSFKEINVK